MEVFTSLALLLGSPTTNGSGSWQWQSGPFRFFIASESIPTHLVATDMVVRILLGPWPSTALAPEGRYDALKFFDDARTRQTVYGNWHDDVFEVPIYLSLLLFSHGSRLGVLKRQFRWNKKLDRQPAKEYVKSRTFLSVCAILGDI